MNFKSMTILRLINIDHLVEDQYDDLKYKYIEIQFQEHFIFEIYT